MVNANKWFRRFSIVCMLIIGDGAYAVPAVVDYVVDGDTFGATVLFDDDVSVPVRVRILNIDTPEIHGKCKSEINKAHLAKDALSNILPQGTKVELDSIKDDKYLGRIDANVVLKDGRNVGDIMINRGLARPYNGGRRRGWCE